MNGTQINSVHETFLPLWTRKPQTLEADKVFRNSALVVTVFAFQTRCVLFLKIAKKFGVSLLECAAA